MPAPLRVRPNFLGDIAFLRRLQKAIEIDEDRPARFCSEAVRKIQSLVLTLDEQRLREEKEQHQAEEAARLSAQQTS